MASAYVQGTTGTSVTSGTTMEASLTGVGVGNLLVALIRFAAQTRTVNSFVGGGTWQRIRRLEGSTISAELWYCQNSTGGNVTATATMSSTLTGGRMFLWEYSGIKTTGSLNEETGLLQAGTTSPQSVGPIVPTENNTRIVTAAVNLTDTRTLINPSGYTQRLNVVSGLPPSGGALVSDLRQESAASIDADWTWTGGTLTGALFIAAFEEEITGPTITVQPTAQTKVLTNANTATFSVTASGTGSLSYDWELEDGVASGVYANVANGNGATWTGQAAASLVGTFTAKTLSGRRVRCNVTDDNGTTTTDAVTLTLFDGPQVTAFGPTDGSGVSTATLTCDYVTGTGEAIEVAVVLPDGRVAVTTTTTA